MSDIVTRLRDRAYSFKAIDRLLEEAADVIERMRGKAVRDNCVSGNQPEIACRPQPTAWAVISQTGTAVVFAFSRQDAEDRAQASDRVVPLYSHPQPTLTDAEREAIREAAGAYFDNDDDDECAKIAATLHGLLKRLK
jgi:hypothetical protein